MLEQPHKLDYNHYFAGVNGRHMRLFGLFLLVFGAVLCFSIVWATVGFLAMAFGLICVQLPTRRPPISVAAFAPVGSAPASVEHAPALPRHEPVRSAVVEGGTHGEAPALNDLRDRDDDLVDVERLLSRYGAIYVDQFRRLYSIFNSKALLPSILRLIIEAARQETDTGENILPESPGPNRYKFEDSASSQITQPIAVSDPTSASFSPGGFAENSPSSDAKLSYCFDDLAGATEPLHATKKVRGAVDPEELANLASIFDQLNRGGK